MIKTYTGSAVSITLLAFCSLIYGISLFLNEHDQSAVAPILLFGTAALAAASCLPHPRNALLGRSDVLHPGVVFFAFFFVYFLFPALMLWESDYVADFVTTKPNTAQDVNTLLFLGAVSVFAFSVGLRAKTRLPGAILLRAVFPDRHLGSRKAGIAVLLLAVVGLTARLYQTAAVGDLAEDFLYNLSPSARRQTGLEVGFWLVVLGSALEWSVLVFSLRVMSQPSSRSQWYALVIFILAVAAFNYFTTGKRSSAAPLLVIPLVAAHYLVKPLTSARATVYFLLGFAGALLSLLARAVLPFMSQGIDPWQYIGNTTSDVILFLLRSAELSTFQMILLALESRESLLDLAGGPVIGFFFYNFSTLVVFIPRLLWPGKPSYEDVSYLFYQLTTGGTDPVGFAPTVWGTAILFLHPVGTGLGFLVLGYVVNSVYRLLAPWRSGPGYVYLYGVFLWTFFQFLRFGTLGYLILLFVGSMLLGVMTLWVLCRER